MGAKMESAVVRRYPRFYLLGQLYQPRSLDPHPGQTAGDHLRDGGVPDHRHFPTHGALQIPGGALADKFGAKKLVNFALLIITAGNFIIGFSNSYYAILVLKFIIGIGTGICFIAGARYVTTFFLGKEIQRAQGVYGGSILLGSGFVIYGIPQLLPLVGWHNIFMITGGMAGCC